MNKEIQYLVSQLQESYNGDPWFGRNAEKLLGEVTETLAFQKPNGQHSIAELVWHMVNWREFVISRFKKDETKDLHYFEANDWRQLDHSDRSLWQHGLQKLNETQEILINILQDQSDSILDKTVEERTYNYRNLLNGIVQHDIYHLGQIAYLVKFLNQQ
ncbi:DinB family protein [Flavisolibacter ginsengisoli]|jgi:uncharacterized damage-inducible protein DinB|uniref:Uncharacterized damage-inducible protein DinB (Forms a four-helix bundle) n=1 Tax=Flavisolibacter ginsengisoli DSM 18119 TaxID=1121884 RepID=A0A1M5DIF6_9BACT|nr:DinB family protein [Flavisolibacter ginsengisoli]SHF66763.1 Uncharacterized damage-inducible protein DinB (forms a four-helix bundle) [Flavisolibacter ginsengisoli DSM 18119]